MPIEVAPDAERCRSLTFFRAVLPRPPTLHLPKKWDFAPAEKIAPVPPHFAPANKFRPIESEPRRCSFSMRRKAMNRAIPLGMPRTRTAAMNYTLEVDIGDFAETWMPADHIFASREEADAAGNMMVDDPHSGATDFRIVETPDEPNARYHAWAGLVTIAEAAELDTPR
jgi:hypothetical protein